MGTRTGDVDPAILFYLGEHGYDIATLKVLCNTKSGMLGVSGLSNDVRTLTEMAAAGQARARLAIDIFCYRIRKYIGMYSAVLGQVDAVVFTGGIGENAAGVRAASCSGLENLGITLDLEANARMVGRREGAITTPDSKVQVLVVPTDEEAAIAEDTYRLARDLQTPPQRLPATGHRR
jgi:acetate kinase